MVLPGVLTLALGTFIQSSSYVPSKKIRDWSWESYWLVQGIFAWLLIPFACALQAVPSPKGLIGLYLSDIHASLAALGFGVLWGMGSLTFGLSVRYLGISLGQTTAIGVCSACGAILGPVLTGHGEKLTGPVLAGVGMMAAGVTLVAMAAYDKAVHCRVEDSRRSIREFDFRKGMTVVLLSGAMSSFFNVGLWAGEALVPECARPLFASLPATLLVTSGGFLVNLAYCLTMSIRNKSYRDFKDASLWRRNLGLCIATACFWFSQFFGLSIAKGMMSDHPALITFSWCMLMSLNMLFTNFWGLVTKEWIGVRKRTLVYLTAGLLVLISSVFLPELLG